MVVLGGVVVTVGGGAGRDFGVRICWVFGGLFGGFVDGVVKGIWGVGLVWSAWHDVWFGGCKFLGWV